jgi:hypothetical protein
VTTPCPPDDRLVELALGQLAGRDRAEVLEHLASCRRCSDEVDALLAVTEQLLLGVEEAEPPPGFESAVLARITAPPAPAARPAPRRHRRRSVLRSVAAAAALAAVFLLGTTLGSEAPALAETSMVTPSGRTVGSVLRYDDDPSWVLLSIPAWARWEAGDYVLRATLDDGSTADLGSITFHGDDGTWATATRRDLGDVAALSVVDGTGKVWCTGSF